MLLNGNKVDFGSFPNKEIYMPLHKIKIGQMNVVRWSYRDDRDIFKLSILAAYIEDMKAEATLYIEYLPYSRMDRVNNCYAFTLKYIASIINNMKFKKVTIREPHSVVSLDMVHNSVADWWCAERVDKVAGLCAANSLFYPDAGAMNRYKVSTKYKSAVGDKTRNFKDGKITRVEIRGFIGKKVLIVDDLCSRGGTFIESAKLLKEKGAKNIFLLVAHCEDNVFTGKVFDHIDRIFTSKEMLSKDHFKITKIK